MFRVTAEWHVIISVTRYDIYVQQIIIIMFCAMLVLFYHAMEHFRVPQK